MGLHDVDWIHVACDKDKLCAAISTAMNLWVL